MPSKSKQEMSRQWKRTARELSRPNPFWMIAGGLISCALTTIVIGLGLSIAYYFGTMERGIIHSHLPMLHAFDQLKSSPTFDRNVEVEHSSENHKSIEPFAMESDAISGATVDADGTEIDGTSSNVTSLAKPNTRGSSAIEAAVLPTNPPAQEIEILETVARPPRTWKDDAVVSTSDPPKACLALIMKNEGPILPRLFESIMGFVSAYCVVDTGSTDDTIDVLRSIDMPGMLVEEPFVDFAVTRNFLLDTCRQRTTCEYLLLLDADMKLRVGSEWDWTKLDGQDVYDFVQVSGYEYANVRMIKRSADKIRVVGATHEYYDVPPEYSHKLLPKSLIYIDDVGDGKAKGDKFQRDERLLKREFEKDPDNVRTVFYLANTLKDQGKYREAIPYYERRATMGGWYAEQDYSWFQLSTCYLALNDLDKGLEYAEKAAFGGWYKRAEPLYFMAFYLHKRGNYELAWYYTTLASKISKPQVSTVLFISYTIYDYWVAYEQASLCRYVFPKERRFCLEQAIAFQNNHHAPDDLIEYHYPDMKEIVQPILRDDDSQRQILYSHELPEHVIVSLAAIRTDTSNNNSRHALVLLLIAEQHREGRLSLQVMTQSADDKTLKIEGETHVHVEGGHELEHFHVIYPDTIVGHSANGAILLMGRLPGNVQHQADKESITGLKTYSTHPLQNMDSPWTLFEGPDGTAYCITQFYPTMDVGYLKLDDASGQARCEHFKFIHNVPRSFSFFRGTLGPAVVYETNEVWILVHSRRADADMLSVIVLGVDFEIRGYTLPFILSHWAEQLVPFNIQMVFQGAGMEKKAVFLYETRAEGGRRATKVESLPVDRIRTMLVTVGP